MIARRAQRFVQNPSPLVVAHFKCASDPYDAQKNPGGYVNFGTAENHLLWDLVGPRLAQSRTLREEHIHYGLLYGTDEFRQAVATLLSNTSGARIDATHLVIASGASAILDMLAYSLCEEGEGILVPTPYYSGFKMDLNARAQARLVPVNLHARDGFALSIAAFEEALRKARSEGIAIKALLVTNPHNPLGRTLPPGVVRDVVAFASRENLHVIFDEIYANSVFGTDPFVSALSFDDAPPDFVHVVYGFAKDFGLSGFKVGVLHTRNADVLAACQEMAYLSPVSTDTQAALTQMLADPAWVTKLQEENRARLAASYKVVSETLAKHDIPHLPANAGIFVWLDLRRFLAQPASFEAERALHAHIVEKAKVNITPGSAFECAEPGWFRLCYAQSADVVRVGVERIARALSGRA